MFRKKLVCLAKKSKTSAKGEQGGTISNEELRGEVLDFPIYIGGTVVRIYDTQSTIMPDIGPPVTDVVSV